MKIGNNIHKKLVYTNKRYAVNISNLQGKIVSVLINISFGDIMTNY